jgi:uncharacterized repeat protein (TIGR03843 family)
MMSFPDDRIQDLATGRIEATGRFVWSSNYTLLVNVQCEDGLFEAVYKPSQGERPLWDFPHQTLAQREVAAYRASEILGWRLVPPTVLRMDGPSGGGSLQLFINTDPQKHFFTFSDEIKAGLRSAAVFDIVINNADRKAGHFLIDQDGQVWLIDHGVCFHEHHKLRTVNWDFVGEEIPGSLLEDLARFDRELETGADTLQELLAADEIKAMRRRIQVLLEQPQFPPPGLSHPFPWPQV